MGDMDVIVEERSQRRTFPVGVIQQLSASSGEPSETDPEFPTAPVSPMGERVLVATGMQLPPGVIVAQLPPTMPSVPQPQVIAGVVGPTAPEPRPWDGVEPPTGYVAPLEPV
ncbi:MAG: hypothetical protein ABUL60_17610 [Myxococcales bacterium]